MAGREPGAVILGELPPCVFRAAEPLFHVDAFEHDFAGQLVGGGEGFPPSRGCAGHDPAAQFPSSAAAGLGQGRSCPGGAGVGIRPGK